MEEYYVFPVIRKRLPLKKEKFNILFGAVYFGQPYFAGVAYPNVSPSGIVKKRLILQTNTIRVNNSGPGIAARVKRGPGTTNVVIKETSITKKI